ncbi:MAG: trigger factor [Spirochaetes bacterium]|nr:MAG: trigger factor [Spirochaetota bacterium]
MVISEKKIERLDQSRNKMTAMVKSNEVRKIYDEMMREYTKTVKIDGFRVGHVPPSVLERKFGETLRLDAMSRVLEKAMEAALEDLDQKPLGFEAPELEGEPDFSLDKDFSFTVSYDVSPSFETPSLEGLSVTVPTAAVSDDDVAKELEQLRERNAIVVEKTGPCETGDIVTLSFKEVDDSGEDVPGSAREDFTFEVGKGLNLYKFDEEIVGLAAGGEKTFSKTYSDDFEYKDLAGKTVTVAVKVTKVKHKDLPTLDDELAQDISEKYKTLDDLKASVRENLEKSLDATLRGMKEDAILAALLEKANIAIPRSMAAAELSMRWESLKREMGMDSDQKMESLMVYSGKTREGLYEEWKPGVEKALAGRLLLDSLLAKSGLSVGDEELEAEYARQAEGGSMSAAEIKAEYEKRQSVEYLKERVLERKFFDQALTIVSVAQGEKKALVDVLRRNQ